MDIYIILLIGHIVGTILGVGGATLVEVHLNQALKDGKMDETERAFMKKDFYTTRVGMFLGFITGMGFVIMAGVHNALSNLFNDGVFLAKMAIFIIIIINAVLLHKHKINLYWGSAFSFISWWAVMLLGIFLSNSIKYFPGQPLVSFIAVMLVYGAFVVAGAFVLHKIREHGKVTLPPPTPASN